MKDDPDLLSQELVEEFTKICSKYKNNIELFAQIGQQTEPKSDLDLLLILKGKHDTIDFHNNVKILSDLSKIFQKKQFSNIPVFSTYRMRVMTEKVYGTLYDPHSFPCHLMIYPSVDRFLKWEKPSIIESFLHKIIPLIGSTKTIKDRASLLHKLNLTSRIDDYAFITDEEYTSFKMNCNNHDFPTIQSAYMIKYVVKYLCGDILVLDGKYSIADSYDYNFILRNPDKFGENLDFIKKASELSLSKDYAVDEIDKLFDGCFKLIQHVSSR